MTKITELLPGGTEGIQHEEHEDHQLLARQIDRGIRTTFLLSVIAIPVSYLVQVVLARTSPDAVGFYASILLWVSFATCFFYFGGNAVLIKFLPTVKPEYRLSFLLSYSALTIGITLFGMFVLRFFPRLLNSVAGPGSIRTAFILFLLIALLNILQQYFLSALKAMMELSLAQILTRITTFGYFLCFGVLLLTLKPWFREQFWLIIVTVHLAVVGLSAGLASFFLVRDLRPHKQSVKFHFPSGFWRFSLLTQISSIVNFFYGRLDQILVLIYASFSGLGIYFVLIQLAGAIQLVSGFFLDSLLPAFTNASLRMGKDVTRSIYFQGARLNQLIITSFTLLLLCFHRVILDTFGPQYASYWYVLVLLIFVNGLNSLGTLNAYLITSVGRMDLLVLCQVLPIAVFLALFKILGAKDSLLKLAIAYGIGVSLGVVAIMVMTIRYLGFGLHVPREFWASLIVLTGVTGTVIAVHPLGTVASFALLLGSFAAFLAIAGYHGPEIKSLVALVRLRDGNLASFSLPARIISIPSAGVPSMGSVPENKI